MTTEHPGAPTTNLFDGNQATIAHSDGYHSNGFNISIELPSTYIISRIRVINRWDLWDRIVGFSVYIVNESETEEYCGSFTEGKLEYEFNQEGVGDKVEIRKEGRVGVVNLAGVGDKVEIRKEGRVGELIRQEWEIR